MTFWEALDAFPPIFVRLAARNRCASGRQVVAYSHQEIAIASGIPLSRVIEISCMLSPDGMTIGEARRFCAACNFDPTNASDRKRQRDHLRICMKKNPDRAPHYLRSSPLWQTQFLPLIQLLKTEMSSSADSRPSPSLATKSAA